MRPEIAARIAQVRRGEVPDGYRKTKLGVAPAEWEITPFHRMFSPLRRRNAVGNRNVLTISAQYGLIAQEDFFSKSVASENTEHYFLLERGDFAYNKSYSNGYPFGALKPLTRYESGVVSPLYICFTPSAVNHCPAYYAQYFDAGMMNREIRAFAQEGARNHGLLNVSVVDFFNTRIFCPPPEEQRRIAAALSAQDSVIALKERLIAEKTRQKRGLMQRLFRSRISSRKPLSALAKITMGQSPNSANYHSAQNGLPLIQGNADIRNRKACPRMYTTEIIKRCGKGDILLSVRAPVGTVARSDINACIGRGICAIDGGEKAEYLYQYLLYFEDKWGPVAQGSTFEAISGNDIANLSVPISDREEAVAEILSAADKELELLRRSLELERRQKQALAQLLLTGLVRLS